VCVVILGGFALLGHLGVLPWAWLYQQRVAGLAGACVLGLIISFAVVLRAPSMGRPFVLELYLGRRENPQYLSGRVDAKMLLYQIGATMLALNIAAFLAHHVQRFTPEPSPGVLLYGALLSWFVVDYLVFEHVHVYTYDIFAERVGFKLVWGCLTFYPYFYCIGLWVAADSPNPGAPTWQLIVAALVFFAGWVLARGANMQKFYFKTAPTRAFLGVLKPETISDGTRALLCNGFWGLSRHINYLGEILMATGLTLTLGQPLLSLAWLYPLYYVALLVPRAHFDGQRCATKYGALWQEYLRRVPKRIVPLIY
jgi:delta14-sterol reductase